jgi:hypothetical protein
MCPPGHIAIHHRSGPKGCYRCHESKDRHCIAQRVASCLGGGSPFEGCRSDCCSAFTAFRTSGGQNSQISSHATYQYLSYWWRGVWSAPGRHSTHCRIEHTDSVIQSERINATDRVSVNVGIRVDAAAQPCRIALNISSNGGVVVSEAICVHPRLPVEDLSRKAQVVDNLSWATVASPFGQKGRTVAGVVPLQYPVLRPTGWRPGIR